MIELRDCLLLYWVWGQLLETNARTVRQYVRGFYVHGFKADGSTFDLLDYTNIL